ncbi:hypothetical protein DMENIID0001_006960 [Sergentomyia squamirostris]
MPDRFLEKLMVPNALVMDDSGLFENSLPEADQPVQIRCLRHVAHFLLCGSSSWALYVLRHDSLLSRAPYLVMLAHGFIGSLRFSHRIFEHRVFNYIYDISRHLARTGIIPLINTQIAVEVFQDPHIAALHSALFVAPTIARPMLAAQEHCEYIDDLVGLTSEVYLGCMATIEDEMGWAMLMEGDFINRFFLTNLCHQIGLPADDFYIIGLSVLCFLGPFKKVDHRSSHNYATCLSHICLAAISGWCLSKTLTLGVYPVAATTFSIMLVHGLVGIFRFGHPNLVVYLRSVYSITFNINRIMPVALITTQLYQRVNNSLWAIIQVSSTGIPILDVIFANGGHDTVKFLILLGNIMSLMYFGVMADNYWALGLALLCILNCFVLDKLAENFTVPLIDLFTVGLCFFCFFSYNSLVELKIDQEYDF